jgi:hypothetical protein
MKDLRKKISVLLDKHPLLGNYGYEAKNPTQEDRESLLSQSGLRQVEHCCRFLQGAKTRKTAPRAPSSYGWKHIVEKDCGEYISNGAFIAAAFLCDIPMSIHSGSRNPVPHISLKWAASKR